MILETARLRLRELVPASVVSLLRPENAPSRAVARTLGMRPTAQTIHRGFLSDVWSVERPV